MYNPWVLNVNALWGGYDTIVEFMCDSLGVFVEETQYAGNIFPDILYCDMDSHVQHQNTLHNADHEDDVDAPVYGNYRAGEGEFLEFGLNKNLGTTLESDK